MEVLLRFILLKDFEVVVGPETTLLLAHIYESKTSFVFISIG
jgi:hypothetical protein